MGTKMPIKFWKKNIARGQTLFPILFDIRTQGESLEAYDSQFFNRMALDR